MWRVLTSTRESMGLRKSAFFLKDGSESLMKGAYRESGGDGMRSRTQWNN